MKLSKEFYLRSDVVIIAKELLGKILISNIDGCYCSAMITETEAYAGIEDRANHAFGNRLTKRTKTMFEEGGHAYIYLCYGVHYLFNVVTNFKNLPDAVLIRAIEPIDGIDIMQKRRKKLEFSPDLSSGPGILTQCLGITTKYNGVNLCGSEIWIEDNNILIQETQIISSPRVGVAYAQEDAKLPYRFRIKDNKWTSKAH